jgi:cytochrome c-type biogenesis protein CcmH
MMKIFLLLIFYFFISITSAAEYREFNDPALEKRYRTLVEELRCLVCQNQSIAESNAPLALDLRQKTYEMLMAGHSDAQVREFMVARYGDFVLYRPPLTLSTLLLWGAPAFLALLGIGFAWRLYQRPAEKMALSPEENARLQQLLNDQPSSSAIPSSNQKNT